MIRRLCALVLLGAACRAKETPREVPLDAAAAPTTTATATLDAAPLLFGFPEKWIDGASCPNEPTTMTWRYDEATYILRQSRCTHFDGPFVYLLVGETRALLVDTGTGAVNIAAVVSPIVNGLPLVVAHTHGHDDHVGGDRAFRGRAQTQLVGASRAAVYEAFGLHGTSPSTFDLGARVVDVIPIPGHQSASVAFYDRRTRVLLTGDTLYPGPLHFEDWTAYQTSVRRLVDFVDQGHPVSHVLGGHIELDRSGREFARATPLHSSERALQLSEADLRELGAAVAGMGARPTRDVHRSFILAPP